ncbi:MAG: helix-turn-helix domain-containing protein [Lachnospiraceae bacterium]|nr:helix-turn-helix domain-containing protein [Lachnospiraceae bacterium]
MEKEVDYGKLGLKIKEIRQKKGLTQDILAELVGCNTSHISNIENNYTKLSLNVLLAISNALDVSIDYLLHDQYHEDISALENELLRTIRNFDDDKKVKLLKIAEIL